MGLSSATLAGLRATSARVNLGAWGCWYADVALDGEHALAGRVTLQIADLTLQGCVLSGGPAKGRSDYRIVAGAGGWGKLLPVWSYATDAGVKFATVLADAAAECGETLGTIDPSLRTGPGFVRPAGPASRVLELLAPGGWYVDEAGVTHLGKRAAGKLPTVMTRTTPVDLARRTVTLASESIATLLPGVTIDGLDVVDVCHTVDAKAGLRSQVWGSLAGGSSRDLDALRKLLDQLDPDRAFRGLTEYRVVTISGKRLNLQAVRPSSTGMPDLPNVRIMPGVGGCDVAPALGSRVLVGFIDSDPSRPTVLAFEDAEGAGFVPASLNLQAGGMVGGEHVMTVEACAVLLHNVIFGLGAAALPSAWLIPGAITGIVNAALGACAVAAPPGLAAQVAAAVTIGGAMATTPVVGNTSAPYTAAIAALSGKVANASGLFPSLGAKAVRTG